VKLSEILIKKLCPLNYDIEATTKTIHSELKKRLIDIYNYSEIIQGSNKAWYNLPNTKLRKENITSDQGSAGFSLGLQRGRC
jgi:hypothetical protein